MLRVEMFILDYYENIIILIFDFIIEVVIIKYDVVVGGEE